jgi:type I restriction enzyme S subunit
MTAQAQNVQRPDGWEVRRLKFIASCNDETLPEATDPTLEIDYVDISGVELESGIKASQRMSFDEAPSRARRIVRDGDAIVSTVRTYLKAIAAIRDPSPELVVSTGFAVLRPRQELDGRFLAYALQASSFVDAVVANSTGVSYPAINPSELVCLRIVFPLDKESQRRIADFLDWKTGQIDALIAKKRELIEKLKEKRLAIIMKAVTNGLNPRAAMRDSGIPWLGRLPRHWALKRMRFVCSRIEQGWSPQCENQPADADTWGIMKVGCVNGDAFDPLENKALPIGVEPLTEYEIRANDILISRANTKELLGSAALVPDGIRPKLILCDKLFRLKQGRDCNASFLVNYLRTPAARFQYEREATGASGSMQNIGQDTIKNVVVPVPPESEQVAISEFLTRQTARMDQLLGRVEDAISRLSEYRSALITDAVTGKLDARPLAIPATA